MNNVPGKMERAETGDKGEMENFTYNEDALYGLQCFVFFLNPRRIGLL